DMLARPQGSADLAGVLIVSRQNEDRMHAGVPIDFFLVGGGNLKTESFTGVDRGQPPGGTKNAGMEPSRLLDGGQQDHAGEVAGAKATDAELSLARGRAELKPARALARLRNAVFEKDRQVRLGAGLDQVVCLGRLFDREPVRDQRRQVEPASGEQVEDRLHVPLFGPANVGGGIIAPALLVVRVITAWTVRARDDEFGFLEVIGPTRQVQPDRSD